VVLYGRSDATINRFGVRFGSADIYRAVDLEALGRPSYMRLFVKMSDNRKLDDAVRETINSQIRQILSPRHVPDEIVAVADIPKILNGKKMEVVTASLIARKASYVMVYYLRVSRVWMINL
jgi:acetoacetyl-CoA synthetase